RDQGGGPAGGERGDARDGDADGLADRGRAVRDHDSGRGAGPGPGGAAAGRPHLGGVPVRPTTPRGGLTALGGDLRREVGATERRTPRLRLGAAATLRLSSPGRRPTCCGRRRTPRTPPDRCTSSCAASSRCTRSTSLRGT